MNIVDHYINELFGMGARPFDIKDMSIPKIMGSNPSVGHQVYDRCILAQKHNVAINKNDVSQNEMWAISNHIEAFNLAEERKRSSIRLWTIIMTGKDLKHGGVYIFIIFDYTKQYLLHAQTILREDMPNKSMKTISVSNVKMGLFTKIAKALKRPKKMIQVPVYRKR